MQSSDSENTNSEGGSSENDTERRNAEDDRWVGALAGAVRSGARGGSEARRAVDAFATGGMSTTGAVEVTAGAAAGGAIGATRGEGVDVGVGAGVEAAGTTRLIALGRGSAEGSEKLLVRESDPGSESESGPTEALLDSRESSGRSGGARASLSGLSAAASTILGDTWRSAAFGTGVATVFGAVAGIAFFSRRAGPLSQSVRSSAGSSGHPMMLTYSPLRWLAMVGAGAARWGKTGAIGAYCGDAGTWGAQWDPYGAMGATPP